MTDLFDWSDEASRAAALARPKGREDPALLEAVRTIVSDVRERGWDALAQHAERIDGALPECVPVAPHAARARKGLDAEVQSAMALAARNIESFHQATRPQDVRVTPLPGLTVEKQWRAIGRAGLYIPGGKAPLFSTLLMLAIPARVAGVHELVVVTPPRRTGGLDPAVAMAAELCGVEAIWTVGGAQAIAALAWGAGDIPAVDRICGPGNAWVAAAKALVSALPGGPGIDLPAGPSELMVIADETADPQLVAADLLSQAEHDRDAQVLLVTPHRAFAAAARARFEEFSNRLGEDFAPLRTILCRDLEEAVGIANLYAPEHLSLATEEAKRLVPEVRNTGAVFAGSAAAETFGDYLAGSSHVLPTDGAARFTGGVSTLTFMKAVTVQSLTAEAAGLLAGPAAALARLEGLEAHARAADARRAA